MKIKVLTRKEPGKIAEACLEAIRTHGFELADDADVLLSLQYDRILPAEELARYRMCFNLHNAKLPEYKGFNCIAHALKNGDATYTSTIIWMEPEVDAGPIAYEREIVLVPWDTVDSVYRRTVRSCVTIVGWLLADLAAGAPVPKKAQVGEGHFYRRHDAV